MPRMPLFSATFAEGRYFDLWLIVHFLGGVTGGFSNVWFGLSSLAVFLVGTGLMILWEGGEYLAGIRESRENRLLDIVVGLLGVVLALAIAARLGTVGQRVAFLVSGSALAFGSFLGWRAHRRRAKTVERPHD